jgi:hypothetical protein
MQSNVIKTSLAAVALALAAGAPQAAAAAKTFDLPPSADLRYVIKAAQKGLTLDGEAAVKWRAGDGKYTLTGESRASILGKILENRSEGTVDANGLAPEKFTEKRFRKDPYTVTFDRVAGTIGFTEGTLSYPIKGGEQDRASAPWQLAAMARATPGKFVPGSELRMFVAGRRDGEPWMFKVAKAEKLRTPMGQFDAVHLVKAPSGDSKDQQIDIWLAPSHEWYPVKVRFSDNGGDDVVEQIIAKITKR